METKYPTEKEIEAYCLVPNITSTRSIITLSPESKIYTLAHNSGEQKRSHMNAAVKK
jgi:hypothetical protein